MEPMPTSRISRSSSFEKLVFVSLGLLAVISPLYINSSPDTDPEEDEPAINLSSWLPFLPLLLTFAIALSLYINRGTNRSNRISSSEKFLGLGLGLLAVVSPLYIDRMAETDPEVEEQTFGLAFLLPLLLLVLVLAIGLSLYLDQSLTRFDPYWIHRVGGSSGGIIVILVILALVLKFKA